MNNFGNMDRGLYEIKNKLLKNENIRRLLFINTPDALSQTAPTMEDVEDYIDVSPVKYMVEDSDKINLSSFIVVYVPVMAFNEQIDNKLVVDIFIQKDLMKLNKNKLRLHQLLTEVINSIENKKIILAGRISLENATFTVVGKKYIGFQLECNIIEEPIENGLE